MRKLVLIACFSLFMSIFYPLPAAMAAAAQPAFRSDASSPQEVQLLKGGGAAYLPYAKEFGCDRLAFADLSDDHDVMTFEYMPNDGLVVDNWKRLMTITLSPMYQDTEKAKVLMKTQIERHLSVIGANAHVNASQVFENSVNQAPALFIDYEVGDGGAREHDAGVFMRVAAHTAAFIQIQARGRKLDATDVGKIKELLNGKAP